MTSRMITPFRDMLSLREAMDQLFNDSFVRSPYTAGGTFSMPLDVQANDDEFVIRANVPGLKPEDLRIEVMDNTVTIRGETKSEQKEEKDNYLLQERHFGVFSRTVSLPTRLDAGKTEAEIENGVLVLRVPKAEEAKPKSITVKARSK